MITLRIVLLMVISIAGGIATAQQAQPSADEAYLELRRSRTPATRLTAERYFNLVALQEWTDATGRFSTQARYVDHDPNFTWVKLEAVRGSGRDRVVREIQVPFDRLSALSQSRVRQIARLKPRLDELVAAEAAAAEEREAAPYGERFGGEFEHGGPPLEGQAVPAEFGDGAWRTSYDVFRQQISASAGPQGVEVNWGGMHELRALSEALAMPAVGEDGSEMKQRAVADAAASVGEVNWEAPYLGISNNLLLGPRIEFQLLPPEGASVEFLMANESDLMRWMQVQPGQTVRFHGRLGLRPPSTIVVWAQMAEDQPGLPMHGTGEGEGPMEFREVDPRQFYGPEFGGRESGGHDFGSPE